MKRSACHSAVLGCAALVLSAAAAAPVMLSPSDWPRSARDVLARDGYEKTGASNMVSAIYLGYRAFDTLGETIVLLAALTGAAFYVHAKKKHALPAFGAQTKKHRTDIINVVAGKLAPVVLLFGCYVMLNGHTSPGGGFQGGVLLASGIIFIAIGRKDGGLGGIHPRLSLFSAESLSRIEAFAFCSILILMFPGTKTGIETLCAWAAEYGIHISFVVSIVALNIVIGLKVASGVALLCVFMLGGEE